MNIWTPLKKPSKISLIIGIILIAYGYLCRLTGIYFFWESLSWGWLILFAGLLFLLIDILKLRSSAAKSTIIPKICIGIVSLILIVKIIFLFVIPKTDAFGAARNYVLNEQGIHNEVGSITGISIHQIGSISSSTDANGEIGEAELTITVKGKSRFKDYTVSLIKEQKTPWQVILVK